MIVRSGGSGSEGSVWATVRCHCVVELISSKQPPSPAWQAASSASGFSISRMIWVWAAIAYLIPRGCRTAMA